MEDKFLSIIEEKDNKHERSKAALAFHSKLG
jgi:hypothetical protein